MMFSHILAYYKKKEKAGNIYDAFIFKYMTPKKGV